MTEPKPIPAIKFRTGTMVRYKTLEVSQDDPDRLQIWEGRFAGMLVDPKFAPIPMYSFLMEEGTETEYVKLVPVQAIVYIDILELEPFTPEDDKNIKDRLQGDPTSYA